MHRRFIQTPVSQFLLFCNNTKINFSLICISVIFTSHYTYASNASKSDINNSSINNISDSVNVLDEQRYTGSLLSPSGAITKAGILALEPYLQSTISRGAYQSDGSVKNSKHRTDSADSFLLIKYAITDNLTIQATPQVNYAWNGKTTSSSVHISDLPVEFQYRWIDQDNAHYRPSFTTFLGMNFPTGNFDQLNRSLDAFGSGQYTLRFGLHSQAAYKIFHRAIRFRWWGVGRKPIGHRNIKGISNYGTDQGFAGTVRGGLFGNAGFSFEFGITKAWVLAFDFQYDWAQGTHIKGNYNHQRYLRHITGASHDFQIAPGIEYNFTPAVGLIAGAALTVDGHNTNDFIQPQCAVNIVF
ncbi:hypothetical protein H3T59_02215 [Commensalibacter sp. M0357]|uniref:hypothetical protein n=1 Tax=Commensalibacter TaxID=1079922 RepID=UPI000EFCE55C|nr:MULTISPECIES: hypothetical protein [Commensalibacter]AYN87139.1 hypothetical protein D9V35_06355 [Commensalibacter melissae]MBI0074441.1 hypothetical protein [Commensalibacter sp. M0357]MBI0084282.1 hypothetical protein [Commensalibacter sp. M0355]